MIGENYTQNTNLRRSLLAASFTILAVGGSATLQPQHHSKPDYELTADALNSHNPDVFKQAIEPRLALGALKKLHQLQATEAATRDLNRTALKPVPVATHKQPAAATAPTVALTIAAKPKVRTAVPKHSEHTNLTEWLNKLGNCESGNNPTENTGNSFYGAYQFTLPTWHSLPSKVTDGYDRPDEAPAAVQDAAILYNTEHSAGLRTQNPGCYASTGISNQPPTD